MKRMFVLISLGVLWAAPAGAVSVWLTLDPVLSSLDPEFGPTESLSGVLSFEVGALPVASTTTFDAGVINVATGGGTSIILDPNVTNPGLGVLNSAGSFLIPSLFLQLDDGSTTNLTLVDVTGSVVFGAGGAKITELVTTLTIDSGGPAGIITATIVAVPEPSTLLLATGGLAILALRSRRSTGERR